MAEDKGLFNLLIHNSKGEPQLIKVHTGGRNKVLNPNGVISNGTQNSAPKGNGMTNGNKSSTSSGHEAASGKDMTNRKRAASQNGTHNEKKPTPAPAPSSSFGKRKRIDKLGKGLRHFSMKVCEKVRAKGSTTYNEVADELVNEFASAEITSLADQQQYDQKNIRRRVYDALNVLMAMNIISKDKKEIRWLGLPTNSLQECLHLLNEKRQRMDRIKSKTKQLQDLILQQICFKRLVNRNVANEEATGRPVMEERAVHLPFLLLKTNNDTVINISASQDKQEFLFQLNDKFDIRDDIDVLKEMGLSFGLEKGTCTKENLKFAQEILPEALRKYVERMAVGEMELDLVSVRDESDTTAEKVKRALVRSRPYRTKYVQVHSDDESDMSCGSCE